MLLVLICCASCAGHEALLSHRPSSTQPQWSRTSKLWGCHCQPDGCTQVMHRHMLQLHVPCQPSSCLILMRLPCSPTCFPISSWSHRFAGASGLGDPLRTSSFSGHAPYLPSPNMSAAIPGKGLPQLLGSSSTAAGGSITGPAGPPPAELLTRAQYLLPVAQLHMARPVVVEFDVTDDGESLLVSLWHQERLSATLEVNTDGNINATGVSNCPLHAALRQAHLAACAG
jgi:hypothetical protein